MWPGVFVIMAHRSDQLENLSNSSSRFTCPSHAGPVSLVPAPVLLNNASTRLSTEPLGLLASRPSCRFHQVNLLTRSLPSSQGRKAILSGDLSSVDLQKIAREAYAGSEPHLAHTQVFGFAGCISLSFNAEKGDALNADVWSTSNTRDFPCRGHDLARALGSRIMIWPGLCWALTVREQAKLQKLDCGRRYRSVRLPAGEGTIAAAVGLLPLFYLFFLRLLMLLLHDAVCLGRGGDRLSDDSSRRRRRRPGTAVSVTVMTAWDACGGGHLTCAGGLWDLDLLQIEAVHSLRWLARPWRSFVETRSWEDGRWIGPWVVGGLDVALGATEVSVPALVLVSCR